MNRGNPICIRLWRLLSSILKLGFLSLFLGMILFVHVSDSFSSEAESNFGYWAIQGSISRQLHSVLQNIAVKRLLLDVAGEPRTAGYMDSALKNTGVSTKQLQRLKLIKWEEGKYRINFYLFTHQDVLRMREITESHASRISDALLKRRNEIEEAVQSYQLPGVDRRAVLYIALGYFSLDLDGLAYTAQRGYRPKSSAMNFIWRTIFPKTIIRGEELFGEGLFLSRKGFYKGGHSTGYDEIGLLSFGDHEIQPRYAFPDILTNPSFKESQKQHIWESLGRLSPREAGKAVGLMMVSLRSGPKSMEELSETAGIEPGDVERLSALLIELGYVADTDNCLSARIPVLTMHDSLFVERIRKIGQEEMEAWFETGYPLLSSELAELEPFRYLPQKDLFYDIWHDTFGAVNRNLVKAGLFSDPYSGFYGAKGIIPAVYEKSLYKKP